MTIADQPNTNTALPLDSLSIKGYRGFKDLTIPKLGRVNLITGKNNVGKSSLLEAVWLYTERASIGVIRTLLQFRDELNFTSDRRGLPEPEVEDAVLSSIAPLFHDTSRMSLLSSLPQTLSIGPGRAIDDLIFTISLRPDSLDSQKEYGDFIDPKTGDILTTYVDVSQGKSGFRISLRSFFRFDHPVVTSSLGRGYSTVFVTSSRLSSSQIGNLWDRIALTSSEESIPSTLRLIDRRIERITVIGSSGTGEGRVAYARLSSGQPPVPLRHLGDGVNRLFGILLAAANSADGVLLLDEIENGLHYTVLADVWKAIFELAARLNVQVFATTHSWECIEAFQTAASDSKAEGALIRLQNKNGDITATVFDEEDLKIITRDQIEVR